MVQNQLILSLPQGIVTATSLGLEEFAAHRSPGSGKYFQGRSILVDLALENNKPAFEYLDEGGWRDAHRDSVAALEKTGAGNRTKTALSNNAFSCTPIDAWKSIHLVKTGGELLEMESTGEPFRFRDGVCVDGMTPDDIAQAAGLERPPHRRPRLYMIFSPIEIVVLSNLTPAEYVWYATHREGKKMRQVAFTELRGNPGVHLAALNILDTARAELTANLKKKTKSIVIGDAFNRVPISAWIGYDREAHGGIYVGNATSSYLWRFPEKIPRLWERAY
ncbi:MAG: hypothetical protein ACOYOB_15425 [Myxococcota bacterium]|jgi:hypothetical protein